MAYASAAVGMLTTTLNNAFPIPSSQIGSVSSASSSRGQTRDEGREEHDHDCAEDGPRSPADEAIWRFERLEWALALDDDQRARCAPASVQEAGNDEQEES